MLMPPRAGVGKFIPAGVVLSPPSAFGVLKLSMFALGEDVFPVWLKFGTIGVLAIVLLPWEEAVVG